MAHEVRWPMNFKFGTLSASAAISDTVLSSAAFASLGTNLTSTVYMPIALINPATGAFEIVWATAHAASATTITVVRGKESTTAQAWPSGTQWVGAPTLYDGLYPTVRLALPSDLPVGARVLIGDEQIAGQKTAAQGVIPSVVANPGDLVGASGALAVNLHGLVKFFRFNTTTDGSGNVTFNLPNSGYSQRNLGAIVQLDNLSQASWAKVISLSLTQVVAQFWDTNAGGPFTANSKPVQGWIICIGA